MNWSLDLFGWVMGTHPVPAVKRKTKALQNATKIFVDVAVIYGLWHAANYWWSGISFFLMSSPFVALRLMYRSLKLFDSSPEERSQAFTEATGSSPTYCGFFWLDMRLGWKAVVSDPISKEQAYMKLRAVVGAVFEDVPNGAFKVYMAVRSYQEGKAAMNPWLLGYTLCMSLLLAFTANDYFSVYSRICTEGCKRGFLEALVLLGQGLAPPSDLERLRTERVVIITTDFRSLSAEAGKMYGKALQFSKVIEHVEFRDSHIREWSDSLSETNAARYFWGNLGDNSHRLTSVSFVPPPSLPQHDRGPTKMEHKSVTCGQAHLLLELREGEGPDNVTWSNPLARAAGGIAGAVPGASDEEVVARMRLAVLHSDDRWCDLLALARARPEALAECSEELMRNACRTGSRHCVELLLRLGGSANEALLRAMLCTNGQQELVTDLLAARADPNCLDSKRNSTWTFLTAFGTKDGNVAQLLLEARADANLQDGHVGFTPLQCSAQHGATEVARTLLQRGVDPNNRGRKACAPLVTSTAVNSVETMRVLVAFRSDLEHPVLYSLDRGVEPGDTALFAAARFGSLAAMRVLLAARADTHATNEAGETALSVAQRTHPECVYLLTGNV